VLSSSAEYASHSLCVFLVSCASFQLFPGCFSCGVSQHQRHRDQPDLWWRRQFQDNTFQFNWKTTGLATGCYAVMVSMDDGTTKTRSSPCVNKE